MFCLVDQVKIYCLSHCLVIQWIVGKWLNIARGTGIPFGRIVFGVIFLFSMQVVPHGQEHCCQCKYTFSFEHDRSVLPMSMLFIGIDIFVCQIDSSSKADISVNYADLSMITGIEFAGQNRYKRIKDTAFDSVALQFFVVSVRQCHDTSHIIINHADIYALSCLFLQDIQNGVPHFSFLNNEILHKDVFLCFFQFFHHSFKFDFSHWKIFCLCISIWRAVGIAGDILRLIDSIF